MDLKAQPAAAGLDGGGDDRSRENTFFLPADFPGADALEEGATITLKVVGKSEDGIEVEREDNESSADESKSEDMGTALEKHMGGSKGSY